MHTFKTMKPIATESEYRKALAAHDWWYAFSDDGSVWRSGRASLDRLSQAAKAIDPQWQIWNEYAPDEMKVAFIGGAK